MTGDDVTSCHLAQEQSSRREEQAARFLSAQRLHEIGRSRPAVFTSCLDEVLFIICMIMSQEVAEYLLSGVTVMAPKLLSDFARSDMVATWSVSAFAINVSAFLLPLGRLADIHGGNLVYTAGSLWNVVWSTIIGFMSNGVAFVVCRAMQGIGTAATLSSGLVLLGTVYRPGPRKNVIFSIYGAMAPVGFFSGIFVASFVSQYASWP